MDVNTAGILITGASGSLGKQLIYEFSQRGIRPVAHVRPSSDTSFIDRLGLEIRYADLRSPTELRALVEGFDAVIHTAAWVNFRQDRLPRFTGINTFGAVELFKAAQKAEVKRFVQVSTVAAIGALRRSEDTESPLLENARPVNEAHSFNLGHLRIPYIMTKRTAEEELLGLAAEGPTELVIVNPSIIVAPSRTGDDRGKALKKLNRFIVPDFPQRLNLVDIRDVAPGIIAALEKGRPGERYILAGDNISAKDLVLAVSSILGRAPHLLRIPRALLNVAARWSLWYSRLLGRGKVSFYPDLVKLLDFDWVYSSLKARRELGYQNRALHITLTDLLNNNFVGSYAKPVNNAQPARWQKEQRPE
ncbi:MAG: NAD-dependent epimerase/dehydratase family protein [Candidatus Zixiibacteriota bacterium]